MATSIYVGNLSYQASEQDIENLFAGFGGISSVKIVRDRETGRSKGFGFVEMDNDAEAESSMEELDGSTFMERQLVVNKARPRREKPRR